MSQTITQVPGKMVEYVANVEFSLNFEDAKNSVKVKAGDHVFYDGIVVKCTRPTGEEIMGRSPSLQSAININWLSEVGADVSNVSVDVKTDAMREGVKYRNGEYDAKTGGSFDEYMKTDKDTVVINQKDMVVRKAMDVDGDQVAVKEVKTTSVTSSTSKNPERKKFSTEVRDSDQYGADRTIPLKGPKKTQKIKAKGKTFKVDDQTPKVSSDPTMQELENLTAVISSETGQSGRVVGKVGGKKMAIEEDSMNDAVVVGKVGQKTAAIEEEGISFKKVDAPKDMTMNVEVKAGSTPVADLSGANTQDEVDKIQGKPNYLDMLPEDWSKMHWVKKEKFIMQIDDIDFVKFIMTVETTKAIQNACKKRLSELTKGQANS